ncbi:DUF4062 domain-containing protein [Halomonas elongata]|uniref:DUF4062 domain-containing protein n=1 Tax=Halomonas elongata (strain ATCC 33173 / DSM 2581 / NBRC 15536 / NCIMB 2198 / 1H9) TaxID=768066 RepID=A0A1R4A4D1_HALED|nr:DUF4062 domain-containing protein [Halomonas elongata]WBF16560.1 DUF4062 domain-containing protein [Halomonas elongata]WPU49001.1 DUF4062 domain-containing protein [Halomonas elongata DSM 2581]SJK83820.1 uncharacterized protein HELO_2941C [Halomonas elongata DSM 2581]
MARQEHVLTVFVASPSDVEAERGRLEDVIRELNITWSRELGIRLDLVRWETHAYPGFGVDAQDLVNEQIPEDYDLFVGIMWCRYGTPTGRAGSGTVEEFERAKSRYDTDKSSVNLMVYFKDEPIPPSHLDPDQLVKVNAFKNSLGAEGGLYWKFAGIDQFEKLIRLHLTRQVQAFKSQSTLAARDEATSNEKEVAAIEYDDAGILDLMEGFQDKFLELTEITKRIAASIEELGAKITERTAEIKDLPRDSKGNADPQEAKRLISMAASDMNHFTARIEAELPLYNDAMNTGMNLFIKAATRSVDLENDPEDVRSGLGALQTLHSKIATSKQTTVEFRESIAGLPRMTTTLNKAKRISVDAIDRLLEELTNSDQLLTESEKVVIDLLDGSGNT